LAAFFGGLALGARALGPRLERSLEPLRWYIACEATLGFWALLLSVALPDASALLASWLGPQPEAWFHWIVAFVGPLLLLLPATCALGATFPALERAVAVGAGPAASAIGALYAANTLGAVGGVLASSLWLTPWLGLAHTAQVCALLNALCALTAALLLAASKASRPSREAQACEARACEAAVALARQTRGLRATLFATGALGIGYEVLVVRALSQVSENTLFSFALALSVCLFGTALGGASYQRWWAGDARPDVLRSRLLAGCAAGCLVAGTGLGWALLGQRAWVAVLRPVLGAATAGVLGEASLALIAFLVPSWLMGALFSALCVEARTHGLGLGRAVAANTLGAALAPLLFGVLLLPTCGLDRSLVLLAGGYLLLLGTEPLARALRDARVLAALTAAVLLLMVSPGLERLELPAGTRVLRSWHGLAASVSVLEDERGVTTLHINHRQQEGSSATLGFDGRLAWLPLLLHPQPRRALFLGLGTGVTARSAAWDPGLRVDVVELLPEVVAASEQFVAALSEAGTAVPSPRVIVADARRFVRAVGPAYDLVVADLFHPARSGAAALFTLEHFAAVRARLAPQGLFCQWLPLHQLDLASLRSIVASYLRVFPRATALLANNGLDTPVLGLLGRAEAQTVELGALRARLRAAPTAARLQRLHLEDELAVLGSFVAGPEALARLAGDAPLNSDDRPLIARQAALNLYAPQEPPSARLLALLRQLDVAPSDAFAASPADAAFSERLTAYFQARDRFIELGVGVQPRADVQAMLDQVGAPLLAILRASPDFRPAYDPLLNMALALGGSAAPQARALLAELAAAQPARPEAARVLQHFPPGGVSP
jgi:spermidine synthase